MGFNISSVLAFGALLSTAYCLPADGCNNAANRQSLSTSQLQAKQPTQSLPANTNVTLQFVGLGVGIQNYSCSSTSAVPKSIGAIATLFDATGYLQDCGNPKTSKLSTRYLKAYNRQHCQASQNLDDDSCQEEINILDLPLLGHHYFGSVNGAGVPFFDIYSGDFLSAQKTGDIPAPPDAFDGGANGHGAIDWLFLPSDGSSRTSGLSEVYRINTAGGNADPAGCSSGDAVISYKYSAEYWFYL